MLVYQNLRSKNDVNGNPRRLWIIYEVLNGMSYGRVIAVYDEGYSDRPQRAANMPELPSIGIEPSEYRRLIKVAKANKIFHYS